MERWHHSFSTLIMFQKVIYLIPNSYIMKLISVLIASKLNAYICGDFSLMLSISAGLSLNIQNKSLSKLKQITWLESEYKVCSPGTKCINQWGVGLLQLVECWGRHHDAPPQPTPQSFQLIITHKYNLHKLWYFLS